MSNLTEISNLFEIKYGVNLELNRLEQCTINKEDSIRFVSRTEKNNGVSATVKKIIGVKPNPENTLSVAGGGSVLATFLQTEPYYSGRDLYILIPKRAMTQIELLFYAHCISKNKYRYNYGRQANRTLKSIKIPAEIPQWVYSIKSDIPEDFIKAIMPEIYSLESSKWLWFKYDDIFDIKRGQSKYIKDLEQGIIPYISATSQNNGITAYTNIYNFKGNNITVSYDGSVGEAFYHDKPFFASEKVAVFELKNHILNPLIALFICTLIRKERYRYNYGLKWSVEGRMKQSLIKLPVTPEGNPDWYFMEKYIKSLPYSKSLEV